MRSMKCTVLTVLILQTVFWVARFVILRRIMDGFIMAIAVGIGWYAYRENMNITFFCYWGMMCLINGSFDLVKVIDYRVNQGPLFESSMGFEYNFPAFTIVAIPLVTLPGAV